LPQTFVRKESRNRTKGRAFATATKLCAANKGRKSSAKYMTTTSHKTMKRERRHRRVRAKISGSIERPRLSIYKSNTQVIAQVIDDESGKTLVGIVSGKSKGKTPRERAIDAAKSLAKDAKAKGIVRVVLDRGGFEYTGTIKAFADSAREAGLEF
jgi:large subunit ribosomal protein L18